jgi:hypothetical protein
MDYIYSCSNVLLNADSREQLMTIHSCQGLIDRAKAGVQTKTDRDERGLPGGHKDTIKAAMLNADSRE